MSRVQIPYAVETKYTLTSAAGGLASGTVVTGPVSGASVSVTLRSDGTSATVYATETGAGILAGGALVTDASGNIPGWLTSNIQYNVTIGAIGAYAGAGPIGFDAPGAIPGRPPLVTTLPSGSDGLEVYFLADATNGVVWHLRYRSGSTSAYKWEFVGGSELQAGDSSARGLTSSSSANTYQVIFGGNQIVMPLGGDYQLTLTGYVLNTGSLSANVSPAINTVSTPGTLIVGTYQASTAPASSGGYAVLGSTVRGVGLIAGTAYTPCVSWSIPSVNFIVAEMLMTARPIRVG